MSDNFDDWDTFAKAFGGNKKKKKSDTAPSSAAAVQSSSSSQWGKYGPGSRLGAQSGAAPPSRTTASGSGFGTSSSATRPENTQLSQSTQTRKSGRSYFADKLAGRTKTIVVTSNSNQTAAQSTAITALNSKPIPTSLTTSSASSSRVNNASKPVYIALMGVTGKGKSTFISHCTLSKPMIGNVSLHSCTQQVSVYPFQYDPNTLIHLVDTPGFNDTLKSDADVLEEIASFLKTTYEQGTKLDGILYLHPISDVRMDGSSMKSLRVLRKICGPEYYKKIMLVTTRWETEGKERGEQVERELFSDNDFWGTMIKGGCKTGRHDNSKTSALRLIGTFVARRTEPEVALNIQKELIDQKKDLLQTTAGREVDHNFAEVIEKAKKEVEEVKKDLIEAQKEKDRKWERELKLHRAQAAMDAKKAEQSYKKMRDTMQLRYEQNCKRIEDELKKLKLENMGYAARAKATSPAPQTKLPSTLNYGTIPSGHVTVADGGNLDFFPSQRLSQARSSQPYMSTSPSPSFNTKLDTSNRNPPPQADTRGDEVDWDSIIDRLFETAESVHNLPRRGKQCPLLFLEHTWLCKKNRELFLAQPMLLELEAPIVIVGDLRGDYHGLWDIFRSCGYPPKTNYLFLGNNVGHGRQSLEVLWTLWAYRAKYPENFFVLRGMNESADMSRVNGFYEECKHRYNIRMYKDSIDCFNCMPIAAVIDDKILAVSSGISPDLNSFDQIRRIMRPTGIPDSGLICDLLCSDPDPDITGWSEGDRGVSFTYGRDVIARFLNKHNMDLIVRGNDLERDGYKILNDSNGKRAHVTLWSTKGYIGGDDKFDNDAAVLNVDKKLQIKLRTLKFEYDEGITSKHYKKSWRNYSKDAWLAISNDN